MIRTICGVRLVDRVTSDALREKVGVNAKIEDILLNCRLCWYSHVILMTQIQKYVKS